MSALYRARARLLACVALVVVFGALSLQASRNIAQASLVLIIPMAFAATGLGEIRGDEPRRILRPVQIAQLLIDITEGLIKRGLNSRLLF